MQLLLLLCIICVITRDLVDQHIILNSIVHRSGEYKNRINKSTDIITNLNNKRDKKNYGPTSEKLKYGDIGATVYGLDLVSGCIRVNKQQV